MFGKLSNMKIARLYNQSYRDHVSDEKTLNTLNIIILSSAIGTLLFSASGGAAFTGYASALGAKEFAFGLISALPVLASILQLWVSYLIEKTGKNKRMFLIGGIIQRISWIVIAFIPYFFSLETSRVWSLITLVTLASMCGSFVSVTHMTLLSTIIPIELRGRYLTNRQRVSTVFSLIAGFYLAYVLDTLPGFTGYTVVFTIGGLAGLAEILMYSKVEFPTRPKGSSDVSFSKTLKECFTVPKTRNFLLFWIFWNFACNIGGPFFGKYSLDVLNLSFMSIIIFGQITSSVMTMLIVPKWGQFIDRYGSKPLLILITAMSTLNILVWFTARPGSALAWFLFNLIGGLCWSGIDTCTVNMQFTHTPERGRPVAIAVYAVVNSIAQGSALILGGALLSFFSPIMQRLDLTFLGTSFDHYKLIFGISFVLRVIAYIVFLPGVENDRELTLKQTYSAIFDNFKFKVRYVFAHLKLRFRKSSR